MPKSNWPRRGGPALVLRRLRTALARIIASDQTRELDAWERGFRAGFEHYLRDREQP